MAKERSAKSDYDSVMEANRQLHGKLAADYDRSEPHFRPENVAKVERQLAELVRRAQARRLLDLGCGTGFMLRIAARHVPWVEGVDITEEMLQRVDRSGPARVDLHLADTGGFAAEPGAYDLVTAYSFLHHLYDVQPTLRTAARALRPGGIFYADLDPNRHFWDALMAHRGAANLSPLMRCEIEKATTGDHEVATRLGLSPDLLLRAEYGKSTTGGIDEADLGRSLTAAGFRDIRFRYHWFLGEAQVIHREGASVEQGLHEAQAVDAALQAALPVSRGLYKYLGVTATRG
jgi:2-polyprenyl-3-methyl-5-hydroxy-6-metoxy-1,4-benzoquinol methylase